MVEAPRRKKETTLCTKRGKRGGERLHRRSRKCIFRTTIDERGREENMVLLVPGNREKKKKKKRSVAKGTRFCLPGEKECKSSMGRENMGGCCHFGGGLGRGVFRPAKLNRGGKEGGGGGGGPGVFSRGGGGGGRLRFLVTEERGGGGRGTEGEGGGGLTPEKTALHRFWGRREGTFLQWGGGEKKENLALSGRKTGPSVRLSPSGKKGKGVSFERKKRKKGGDLP